MNFRIFPELTDKELEDGGKIWRIVNDGNMYPTYGKNFFKDYVSHPETVPPDISPTLLKKSIWEDKASKKFHNCVGVEICRIYDEETTSKTLLLLKITRGKREGDYVIMGMRGCRRIYEKGIRRSRN